MSIGESLMVWWIFPYISIHLLSLNPLGARDRRYSRDKRYGEKYRLLLTNEILSGCTHQLMAFHQEKFTVSADRAYLKVIHHLAKLSRNALVKQPLFWGARHPENQ